MRKGACEGSIAVGSKERKCGRMERIHLLLWFTQSPPQAATHQSDMVYPLLIWIWKTSYSWMKAAS
jgi:hypothetical protein